MPVENERKYVLRMMPHLENKFLKAARQVYHIEQAYLFRGKGLTVRIRKQRDKRGKEVHILTTKQRVGTKIIEVEKKVSAEDYAELSKVADGKLTKVRYVLKGWEVDFFKTKTETYFVMAEIELPDGVAGPDKLPKFVSNNLLLEVPINDCRFSSKKLSDVEYAQTLLREVVRSNSGDATKNSCH